MNTINQKFLNVEYKEGEDLNIENMKQRIVTKAWYDTARFNDITDVAVGIGGNISNSVTKTNYYLKNNKIDKSKDKKSYGGIFAVIKNLK